ncbi:hypothetical protein CHL79_25460 [Delftia acidovorans]|nr:hypothetical protein CHL79_25460 [Delftia acidovorans]
MEEQIPRTLRLRRASRCDAFQSQRELLQPDSEARQVQTTPRRSGTLRQRGGGDVGLAGLGCGGTNTQVRATCRFLQRLDGLTTQAQQDGFKVESDKRAASAALLDETGFFQAVSGVSLHLRSECKGFADVELRGRDTAVVQLASPHLIAMALKKV